MGNDITLTAREILETKINETADKYPPALKTKHLLEIMNCYKAELYPLLNNGQIPAAKKIPGLGWRIPRDVFLSWWYGNEQEVKV
jgi:hypothetical protein